MINFVRKPQYGYEDLLEIIRLLRSEDGCPWDKAQTHQSIRRGLLEEAYEAAEAIDNDDPVLLKEELGDVLMQVVFHADIESDAGRFTIDDVCDGVVKKLLFRHPHVFGSRHEDSPEAVPVSWDKLKRQEKGQKTVADSMDSVARSLPGLWRAEKLQNKAASAGFEWPDVQGALDKLEEEVAELRRAVKVGRFCACDPEDAVNSTCEKFIRRFRAVENGAAAQGREVSQLSLEEMTALWNEAKRS